MMQKKRLSLPPSKEKGDFSKFMVSLVPALAVCAVGLSVLITLTGGAQWFTSESYRRNELVSSQKALPNAALENSKSEKITLESLCEKGPVALNFVYTRCTSVCSSMGASAAQLAIQFEKANSSAQVLSISFDSRDTANELRAFKRRLDPLNSSWTIARVADHPLALNNFLKQAGVVVIPDELEEFTHNTAWLLLDKSCRVQQVFDLEQTEHVEKQLLQSL